MQIARAAIAHGAKAVDLTRSGLDKAAVAEIGTYQAFYDAAGKAYDKAANLARTADETLAIAREAMEASTHASLYAYNGYVASGKNEIQAAGVAGFKAALGRARYKDETRAIYEAARRHDFRHWSRHLDEVRHEAWKKGETLPERGFWARTMAALRRMV